MKAYELISQLENQGITLTVNGNMIFARPKGKVTPTIIEQLKSHKPEILHLLQKDTATPAPECPGCPHLVDQEWCQHPSPNPAWLWQFSLAARLDGCPNNQTWH